MANHFVRSTDGNDADDGSTWALAKATLNGVTEAAGDRTFVSARHSESYGSGQTLNFGGSFDDPTWILCVDDTGDPASPTTLATGALFAVTSSSVISISGWAYIYGLEFRCDLGLANNSMQLASAAGNRQVYDHCTFRVGDGAAVRIDIGVVGNGNVASVEWRECSAETGTQGGFHVACDFRWYGGALLSQANGSTLFRFSRPGFSGRAGSLEVRGVDLSAMSASSDLVQGNTAWAIVATFIDCKLPASWTGTLVDSVPVTHGAFRVSMYNCDSGDTNYRLWIEDIAGTIRDETTIVKTGGASDGTTQLAWKMTTASVSSELYRTLYSDWIPIWVDAAGASKTIEIDLIHDGATNLQDDEVWIELSYPGDANTPLASFIDDRRADVLATPADQDSSSASWTTTGLTSPNAQKLSVTFTPQNKGVCYARVALAKPSQTIYVDPLPVVS